MFPDKLLASRVHSVNIKLARVMVAVMALKCGRYGIVPDMIAVCLSGCMIAGVEPFRNLLQLFDDNIARKITDQMVLHRCQIHFGCRLEISYLSPGVGAGIRPARADAFDFFSCHCRQDILYFTLNGFVRIPEPLPSQVSAAIILDRHFYISHFISLKHRILGIVTCLVLLYYNGYHAGLGCFR